MSSSHDPIRHPTPRTCQYPNLDNLGPPLTRAHATHAHARQPAHQSTSSTPRARHQTRPPPRAAPPNGSAKNQTLRRIIERTPRARPYAHARGHPAPRCTRSAPRDHHSARSAGSRPTPHRPDVPTPPARNKVSWSFWAPQENLSPREPSSLPAPSGFHVERRVLGCEGSSLPRGSLSLGSGPCPCRARGVPCWCPRPVGPRVEVPPGHVSAAAQCFVRFVIVCVRCGPWDRRTRCRPAATRPL